MEGHKGDVNAVAMTKDGTVVSGSDDKEIRLWGGSSVTDGSSTTDAENKQVGCVVIACLFLNKICYFFFFPPSFFSFPSFTIDKRG